MGHLGLTPQSIYKFGTYTVRAKRRNGSKETEIRCITAGEAGCFCDSIGKIPAMLAKEVAESVSIPVIGIGAGKYCDG
jgi:3-methyl-2-oxobutanoate hydroxymethyltransferase